MFSDDRLYVFIHALSKDPSNWKTIIKLIKDVELYSSDYGDIIFMMRDTILENDKLSEKNKNYIISEFQIEPCWLLFCEDTMKCKKT